MPKTHSNSQFVERHREKMEKKKEMDSRKENKAIRWIWKKDEVMLDVKKKETKISMKINEKKKKSWGRDEN